MRNAVPSKAVFVTVDRPLVEPEGRLRAFCHAVEDNWHLMLSAAGSMRRHRDTLAPGIDFDALLAPATGVTPGSDGLLFLLCLTGERTPIRWHGASPCALPCATPGRTWPAPCWRAWPLACADTIHLTGTTAPGPDGAAYGEIYPLYRDRYPALRPALSRVGRLLA